MARARQPDPSDGPSESRHAGPTRRRGARWRAEARPWGPAVLLAAAFALCALAVDGRLLTGLDAAAQPLHGVPGTIGASVFIAITALGGVPAVAAVTLVAVALALMAGRPSDAVLVVLAVATARLLTVGVKLGFERARPRPPDPIGAEASFAFPSGHSSAAAAVYGAVALVVLRSRLPRSLRLTVALGAGVLIAAVAYSRIYLGVHHPTDVVGGLLLGFACLAGSAAVVGTRSQRRRRRERGSPFAARKAS